MVEGGRILSEKGRSRFNIVLLVLVVCIIFIAPLLPAKYHKPIYNTVFTFIFFSAAFSMEKHRKLIVIMAFVTTVTEWISYSLERQLLLEISRLVMFFFFIMIVLGLIIQIAKTRKVTGRVIIESINGYLLLGLLFSLIVGIIALRAPESFSAKMGSPEFIETNYHMSQYIYYTFTTFTTLGYGDIVPLAPYAKSLAILMAVSGQIYLTVIIAMLVGKFLAYSKETA